MKTKNILITGVIVIALFVGGVYLYNYLQDEEAVEGTTLDEKLEMAKFSADEKYYVREVVQDDGTYVEVLDITEDNFIRTITEDSDKEVFSYNYSDDTFTYLYYFEDELIMKVVYDYISETVTEDEDEQYDNLKVDIEHLKAYFQEILVSNGLEVSEL